MDPRRIELNKRHSREMGELFHRFLGAHPDVDSEVLGVEMTDAQEAAWTAFSSDLLARHQAERAALADEIRAEQLRS
jgi:transposase-like protein